MNYQKVYENLIQSARLQKRIKHNGIYYENHHIIPRCLGGIDDEENLVLLTAREHFICHKLLTYIYKGNRKIACAFNLMVFMNDRKYGVTSRDYAYARELFILTPVCEETRIKRKKPKSPEHREKLRLASLKWHAEVGHSEETKKKISKANKGKKYTPEQIENYKRGNKNKNIGVEHSKESLLQASKKLKGKIPWNKDLKGCFSEETRRKMSESAKNRKRK